MSKKYRGEEAELVSEEVAAIDWAARFAAMSDAEFAALTVPAPKFATEELLDGSIVLTPVIEEMK